MKLNSQLQLRIDWSELDLFGHVNNVMYFKYIQAARVHFWQAAGIYQQFEQDKVGPILANTACQFIKPLFFPGQVLIETELEFTKNTSFGLKHTISNEQQELVGQAHDVIVWFDFKRNAKSSLPPALRAGGKD